MKKVIITGGNSGIGYQSAKQLAEKGWSVTLFCRRKEAAEQACEEIRQQTGNPHVDYILVDLSDMKSVRKAAEQYIQKEDVLDSQASSFPTLYLDGATLLFSVFQFLRKHELV